MKFTKMHGAGNDYVYVDGFSENVADPAALAKAVSDRRPDPDPSIHGR